MGCDVRYLNDSYRLNGLKAAQQVRLLPSRQRVSIPKVAGHASPTVRNLTYKDHLQGSVESSLRDVNMLNMHAFLWEVM